MNPLTNVKNINKLNELELSKGLTDKKSWHDIYKDSAWIFIGGLAYVLTEGDILCVFSQYGEIVHLNLVRDKKTGKTKGFCFLCYANQKSTVLAVDNLNGIKLLGRTLRVDHVSNYKPPKDNELDDEVTKQLKAEGCAPKPIKLEKSPVQTEIVEEKKKKKAKKEKKKHKKKTKKQNDDESSYKRIKLKKEKKDPGYDKYEFPHNSEISGSKHKNAHQSDSSSSETSSDNYSSRIEKERLSKGADYDKRTWKNHDQPGPSGYRESSKKDNYQEKESARKNKRRDSESDSDEDYPKRKKFQTNNFLNGATHSKHSDSFRATCRPSQSSDESSDKYSSTIDSRKGAKSKSTEPYRKGYKYQHPDSSSSTDKSPTKSSSKSLEGRDRSRYEDSQYKSSDYASKKTHRESSSVDSREHLKSKDYNKNRSNSDEQPRLYSKNSHRNEYKREKNDRKER